MSVFKVPDGLKEWDMWVVPILESPFPPKNEPVPNGTPKLDNISTCDLLCEEVVDTEPLPGQLTINYHELLRRGFTDVQIREMRHFVWLTVGWLNYKMMHLEWVHLDESDVRIAIDMQQRENLIDIETARNMHRYLNEIIMRGVGTQDVGSQNPDATKNESQK